MAPLCSLRPAPDGWLVFDILTGEVLVLDGQAQTGLSFQQADALVDRLNSVAVHQLLAAPANDLGEAGGKF